MKIPNVIITLKGANNASAVKYLPRWFVAMFRAVWAGRLDPEHGLEVQPIPDGAAEVERYSEYDSVQQAELATVQFFAAGDQNREGDMARLFARLYPDGLRAEIQEILREDAQTYQARKARETVAPPHPSYLEVDVSPTIAQRLQQAGYATLAAIPDDIVAVAEAGGLAAGEAAELIAKARAAAVPATPTAKTPEPAAAGAK